MRSIISIATVFAVALALQHNSLIAGDHGPVVIIHGAWGGAHHWKSVDDLLTQKHGRTVRRASLTGLGERSHLATPQVNLNTHIQDVVSLIEFDDLKSVTLIAHSYGGVVAQGVVNTIPDRLAQVIYIDSHLLKDGECYFTHHADKRKHFTQRANDAGDGWLIPVDWKNPMLDTPHPLATLEQAIRLEKANQDQVPAVYWLLADGKHAELDERCRYCERAMDQGMRAKIFPWKHNPQRDIPDDLVRALVKEMASN